MAQVEGSALVAQAIRREGIEVLFGLAGGPIQDIMGFAPHCGVRPIGVHHEQAATFAAAAYGYVKNQVGVAVLAAGPGVTNGVTGAHVAYDNCFPLVILGGSGPQRARYTGTFQETENIPMFKGITKMAVQVDSTARLPEYMAMAFRKARTGRPGPVYLDLPSDVLQNAVDEERVRWPESYYTQARPLGDPDQVKRAAELLRTAERPMLIVGKGIRWSEPTLELRRLVETLGMPFMASPMGRGFIPDDHPLNFGTARSTLMGNADVILVVGARLTWMFGFGRQFAPDAKIIQIDIEPEEIGVNRAVEVGLIGDARAVMQQVLAELEGQTAGMAERAEDSAWLAMLREQAHKNAAALEPLLHATAMPIRTHRLLHEVREVFPRRDHLHGGRADDPGHRSPGAPELHAGQSPQLRLQRLHGRRCALRRGRQAGAAGGAGGQRQWGLCLRLQLHGDGNGGAPQAPHRLRGEQQLGHRGREPGGAHGTPRRVSGARGHLHA